MVSAILRRGVVRTFDMNLCGQDLGQHFRVGRVEPEIPSEEPEIGFAGTGAVVGFCENGEGWPGLDLVRVDIRITRHCEARAGWQQYEIAFGQFDRIAAVSLEMAFARHHHTKAGGAGTGITDSPAARAADHF